MGSRGCGGELILGVQKPADRLDELVIGVCDQAAPEMFVVLRLSSVAELLIVIDGCYCAGVPRSSKILRCFRDLIVQSSKGGFWLGR